MSSGGLSSLVDTRYVPLVTDAVELATVVGRNAKSLRHLSTADDVARATRRYGLNWGTGRISDLEHGRVSPTLPTLVILALALSDVCGRNVTVAELVDSDQSISLTKDFDVTSDELKAILYGDEEAYRRLVNQAVGRAGAGAKAEIAAWPARLQQGVSVGELQQVYADYGEAEQLLERELGVDRGRLAAEMAALWGKAFHVKRDELAGSDANAQKKGRVSRALKAELKAVLDGDD